MIIPISTDIVGRGLMEKTGKSNNLKLSNLLNKINNAEMITICMHCEKIRLEEGQWVRSDYVRLYVNPSNLSHGVCPACAKVYYPQFLHK
jgi:hypothetical protein